MEPYHDYDDVFSEDQLRGLDRSERLICRVEDCACFGGEEPTDPGFNWRVYAFKVTVFSDSGRRGH